MSKHGLSNEEQRRIIARMPRMQPFQRMVYELMLYNDMTYDKAHDAARIKWAVIYGE